MTLSAKWQQFWDNVGVWLMLVAAAFGFGAIVATVLIHFGFGQ